MFCYVPGCPNANSGSPEPKKARMVQVFFSAPEDESLFGQWQLAVPKSDHLFSRNDKLCDFHFKKSEVVLFTETKLPNGNVRRIPATEPKLKAGTVPSIFPATKSFSGAPVPLTKPSNVQQKVTTAEGPKSKRKQKISSSDDSDIQEVSTARSTRTRPRRIIKPSGKYSDGAPTVTDADKNLVEEADSMTLLEMDIIKDVDSDIDPNEGVPQPKKPAIRVKPLAALMAENEPGKKRKLPEPVKKLVAEKKRKPGPKSKTRVSTAKRYLDKITEELEMAINDFSDGDYEIEHVTDVGDHVPDIHVEDTFEAVSIKSDPDDSEQHMREPRIAGVISLCDMDNDGTTMLRQVDADASGEIENEIANLLGEHGPLHAKGRKAGAIELSGTAQVKEAANSSLKEKDSPEELSLNIDKPPSHKPPVSAKPISSDKPQDDKPQDDKSQDDKPQDGKSQNDKSQNDQPQDDQSHDDKPQESTVREEIGKEVILEAANSKDITSEIDEVAAKQDKSVEEPVKPLDEEVPTEENKSIEKSDSGAPSEEIGESPSIEENEKCNSKPLGQEDKMISPNRNIEESLDKTEAVVLESNDQVRISTVEHDAEGDALQEPKKVVSAEVGQNTKGSGDALSDLDVIISSSPEHLSISSDSDRDPTWQPNAETVEISDDNDTDPGNVDDEEKANSGTTTSEAKGEKPSPAVENPQQVSVSTDLAKLLTHETVQKILKTLKLPLDSPVTFTIGDPPAVVTPPASSKKKEKPGTPKATIKTPPPPKNEKTVRPNKRPTQIAPEKGKKCEKLLGVKMFEGLGKIKKSFAFSTFLNDIEDELQFRKFCLIVKECLREVCESKNAVTNVGKLTINMTPKVVKSTMPVPELKLLSGKPSAVTSKTKTDIELENINDPEMNDVLECSTVDSNVENHISFPLKDEGETAAAL